MKEPRKPGFKMISHATHLVVSREAVERVRDIIENKGWDEEAKRGMRMVLHELGLAGKERGK